MIYKDKEGRVYGAMAVNDRWGVVRFGRDGGTFTVLYEHPTREGTEAELRDMERAGLIEVAR